MRPHHVSCSLKPHQHHHHPCLSYFHINISFAAEWPFVRHPDEYNLWQGTSQTKLFLQTSKSARSKPSSSSAQMNDFTPKLDTFRSVTSTESDDTICVIYSVSSSNSPLPNKCEEFTFLCVALLPLLHTFWFFTRLLKIADVVVSAQTALIAQLTDCSTKRVSI